MQKWKLETLHTFLLNYPKTPKTANDSEMSSKCQYLYNGLISAEKKMIVCVFQVYSSVADIINTTTSTHTQHTPLSISTVVFN